MLKGECKDLFMSVLDYTDNIMAMQDFIELLEKWVDWNNGNIRIALINLNDYGFPLHEMIIAYDDMGGCMNTTIYKPFEFVELIIDVLNEYDDEEYLEDFWIPRLKGFIEDNEY